MTGEEVELGDLVLIESGKTPGIVAEIIEAPEGLRIYGLDEPGISINSDPFGRVFWPQSEVEDPVRFVARRK